MTPENFCYWLKGFFEIGEPENDLITQKQVREIKRHLDYVFSSYVKQEDLKDILSGSLDASILEKLDNIRIC